VRFFGLLKVDKIVSEKKNKRKRKNENITNRRRHFYRAKV
jgi:hypothetical protein